MYKRQGIDGAPGEQGPPGPTGPSNISETNISLILFNNTITIPEQDNSITYYTMNVYDHDEIKSIQSNLKNNQMAIILIELFDVQNNEHSSATIFTMHDTNLTINYNKNILLNHDMPFAICKIYNINNNIFVECISYYKNNFISFFFVNNGKCVSNLLQAPGLRIWGYCLYHPKFPLSHQKYRR